MSTTGLLRAARPAPAGTVPCALHLAGAPPSIYKEYAPPPALKPYLVCTWTLEIGSGSRPHRQRILPDGCSDIIWIGESAPVVVGPMTHAALSTSPPGTTLVGLRFRPETAARVFGVAAYELADRHTSLDQLWPRAAVAEASQRLLERRTAGGRVAIALSLLASQHRAIRSPDRLVQRAMSLLYAPGHELRIEKVAQRVGASERHLRRLFMASVGYSPKVFQRVLRFQKLLALKVDQASRLGRLALVAGYADQAHMTREVREFGGVTPSALVGKVVSAITLTELFSGARKAALVQCAPDCLDRSVERATSREIVRRL